MPASLAHHAAEARVDVFQEPAIGRVDPLMEGDLGLPTQLSQRGHVEHLAGHAVGLAGVEHQAGSGVDNRLDLLGQLLDRQVLTGADLDVARLVVVGHQERAGIGQIIDVQELSPWLATTPNFHRSVTSLFRLMEFPQQSWQYMRILQIKIIAWAV